jgi:phosphoenolpyruvate carboxykinase (GTP)
MAILDFLVVPFGKYLNNHIDFGRRLKRVPQVFSTNYFLKHEGRYTNEKVDKKVWLLWAEGRIHGEYDAIETPVGYIPHYKDLRALFQQVFKREYTEKDYIQQFSIRVTKYLEKLERMEKLYGDEEDMPEEFWATHRRIKKSLQELRKKGEIIPPSSFK